MPFEKNGTKKRVKKVIFWREKVFFEKVRKKGEKLFFFFSKKKFRKKLREKKGGKKRVFSLFLVFFFFLFLFEGERDGRGSRVVSSLESCFTVLRRAVLILFARVVVL